MGKIIVTFGEIMLRLSPPGFQRFGQARSFDVVYGGGEANVAVSLANYGLPVAFVTRVPANDLGDACLQFVRQYGVSVAEEKLCVPTTGMDGLPLMTPAALMLFGVVVLLVP